MKPIAVLLSLSLLLGTAALPAMAAETTEETVMTYPSDAVAWEELEERIRGGSLQARALRESEARIDSINYTLLYEDLRKQLNNLASYQWALCQMGNSAGADNLQKSYDALRDTFDDLKDGKVQKDNGDVVRQLENGVDQVVIAGEGLYLTLLSLEDSLADGERGLAALDRSLAEARLRQKLGQVPSQTVHDLERKREDAVVGLETLKSNILNGKLQLQRLLGVEPTGVLTLAPLPESETAERDPEADLAAAKETSWALYSAELTLEDAREEWKDAKDDHPTGYQRDMADHAWNAAQIQYESTVKEFEAGFQSLCRTLENDERALANQESALRYQENQLALAQVRYGLGLISRYALLNAQDAVETARSQVKAAKLQLFTDQNRYRNAVEYGILN